MSLPDPDCPLIGTWTLLGWQDLVDDDSLAPAPEWERVRGQLIYTPEGAMTMQMSKADREHFVPDPAHDGGTSEEKARAFNECHAYSGSFTFESHRVIHHIEQSNAPNYVGTDQVRLVSIDGETLVLTNANGTRALAWQRFDPGPRPIGCASRPDVTS